MSCVGLFLRLLSVPSTPISFCPVIYLNCTNIWLCLITIIHNTTDSLWAQSPLPCSGLDSSSHPWSFLFHIHFRISSGPFSSSHIILESSSGPFLFSPFIQNPQLSCKTLLRFWTELVDEFGERMDTSAIFLSTCGCGTYFCFLLRSVNKILYFYSIVLTHF